MKKHSNFAVACNVPYGEQLVEKCNNGITRCKCIYIYICTCVHMHVSDEYLTHTRLCIAMHESDFLRATFAVHYIPVRTFRLPLQSPWETFFYE